MTYDLNKIFSLMIKNDMGEIYFNSSLFSDYKNIKELYNFFDDMTTYGFEGTITIPSFKYIHRNGEEEIVNETEFDLSVVESEQIFESAYEGKTFLRYEGIIYDYNHDQHFKFSSQHLKALDNHINSFTMTEFVPEEKDDIESEGIFFIVQRENNHISIHGIFSSLKDAIAQTENLSVINDNNCVIEKMPFNSLLVHHNLTDFFNNAINHYNINGTEIN